MSPDEDFGEGLPEVRHSGLFETGRALSPLDEEEVELSPPSFSAIRDAITRLDSAVELGVNGDDLELFVCDVCRRCFPGRTPFFLLDDAPERPSLSRASAERHGVSDAMLDEAGIDLVETYQPRDEASAFGFDVPIQSEGKLLGVLSLEYPGATVVYDDDREALAIIALAIGSALSRTRASDERRRLIDQLRHQQKLATIGQFAASITHEMNHPLTTISVYSDLLLLRAHDLQRDEWETTRLTRIAAAAARMREFVKDLVEYARPSAKERVHESLEAIVQRSLAICEPVVSSNGATVEVLIEPEVGALYCVASQLEQVFVNLVSNAAQAFDAQGGRIRISAKREDDRARIRVEDDGPGIPEAHREAIFEAFFSTKGPGVGTGLGLSIVKRIVEDHGGTIAAGVAEIGGAAFEIVLPGLTRR